MGYSTEQLNYIKAHYETLGPTKCGAVLGRSKGTMAGQARRMGLRYKRKYNAPIDLTQIQTPYFAYVLGYLWADGSISREFHSVRLTIRLDDAEAINQTMMKCGQWSKYAETRRCPSGVINTYRVFTVHDRAFHGFLTENGYRNKSRRGAEGILKTLGPELHSYFVRGVFDGDGHISCSAHGCSVAITADHDFDWNPLIQVLQTAGIYTSLYHFNQGKKGRYSSLAINGHEALCRLGIYMFGGEPFGLQRKRQRFIDRARQVIATHEKRAYCIKNPEGPGYYPRFIHEGKYHCPPMQPTSEDASRVAREEQAKLNTRWHQKDQWAKRLLEALT